MYEDDKAEDPRGPVAAEIAGTEAMLANVTRERDRRLEYAAEMTAEMAKWQGRLDDLRDRLAAIEAELEAGDEAGGSENTRRA